jgi:hypothetical protein
LLTRVQARRLAVAAAGLGSARPAGRIGPAHVRKVVDRVGFVQLDSVSAVARAHDLLFFSRLGAFDTAVVHDVAYRRRELYEGSMQGVAALLRTGDWPLLEWRRSRDDGHGAQFLSRIERAVIDEVLELLRTRGPLAASDLAHLGPSSGPWWGWSRGKIVLEGLLRYGDVAVTTRRGGFERVYDLAERVIPAAVLAAPPVPERESRRRLVVDAARTLGVATARDLARYHRQKITPAKAAVSDAVAAGELEPVEVDGWKDAGYVVPGVTVPRRGCPGGRLLSPFDPLVWDRDRVRRVFDFDYAIEIYTPEPKRVYGYYVLPFVQGDEIVARVDVRADRKAGVLRVPGAFAEPGASVDLDALVAELRLLASWQGCSAIEVGTRGDLAPRLRRVRP